MRKSKKRVYILWKPESQDDPLELTNLSVLAKAWKIPLGKLLDSIESGDLVNGFFIDIKI